MKKGYYFILEGTEYCGKDAQCELLEKALLKLGNDVVVTREPGGTPEAEKIRDILKNPNLKHNFLADICLFEAARSYVVSDFILPAIAQGKIVLSKRSHYSTDIYQGYLDEFVTDENRAEVLYLISTFNRIALAGLKPSGAYILDLTVEEVFRRRASTDRSADRFDDKDRSIHEKLIEGYRRLKLIYPNEIEIINSERPREIVHQEILQKVLKIIERDK